MPIIKEWQKKNLSKNEVEEFLEVDSTRNIAVKTGIDSKVLVLDFDGRLGRKDYRSLILDNNIDSFTIRTPNGFHVYFRSEQEWPGTIKVIAKGVDVRSRGNCCIAIGEGYEVANNSDIVPIPDLILDKLNSLKKPDEISLEPEVDSYGNIDIDYYIYNLPVIQKGKRDQKLFKIACYLRDYNLTTKDVEEILTRINTEKVIPPVEDRTLKKKVSQAFKYEKYSFKRMDLPFVMSKKVYSIIDELPPKDRARAFHLYIEMYNVHANWGMKYQEISNYAYFYSVRLECSIKTIRPLLTYFEKKKIYKVRKGNWKKGEDVRTKFLIFNSNL